jgi:hypothetical protein
MQLPDTEPGIEDEPCQWFQQLRQRFDGACFHIHLKKHPVHHPI